MGKSNDKRVRILAIDPFSRGIGYSVIEGPSRLVDWGIKSTRGGNHAAVIQKVEKLIHLMKPTVVLLEDIKHGSCRRRARMRKLIQQISRKVEQRGFQVISIPRARVLEPFSRFNASSKVSMARIIASQYPELEDILPPDRKPWMTEDPRINVFDAIAMIWCLSRIPEFE